MGLSYDIHRLHLSRVVIFVCVFFLWHIGTKDAVPMRLLCFLLLFFYIDLISICRVKNSSTDGFAMRIFHVLQKTWVLFECLTVQDGSEYYLIPIYWITE